MDPFATGASSQHFRIFLHYFVMCLHAASSNMPARRSVIKALVEGLRKSGPDRQGQDHGDPVGGLHRRAGEGADGGQADADHDQAANHSGLPRGAEAIEGAYAVGYRMVCW